MAQRERSIVHRSVLLVVIAAVTACGGGDDDGNDSGDTGDTGDNGGADAGVIGDPNCGQPDLVGTSGDCEEPPCLGVPEYGFQVRSVGTTIQPAQDVEYCEVVQLPGDPSDTYYVNGFDSEMTIGSHHLIVVAIEPGSETEQNAQVGDRVECITPDSAGWGGDVYEVTGQQVPYHEDTFPDGVGRVYHGGQKVIFDYHYLNASDEPIQARAAVNFYTAEESCVERIAESAGFYFFGIDVDPGDTASYTRECTFSQDVMVHRLSRHTHKWGTDFPVEFAGGERDGDLIYTSPNYEDPDYTFDEPVLVRAGEGFRWTCNYVNDTDPPHTLRFGPNATDEMCILFSLIYSPDGREIPGEEGCALYL
ncbi:MAG TPA: hypothetical protein VFU21_19855 [Kofleriaceae bacterium]|nr:hypothetical protein [Kofleriaceae bacterium]